ncbi:protein neuralized isoform X2 [Rhipicephalus sanguineus]|uniref:protein neuralized isoform X2 n=1 Tax=Rhipicephalus sanguineus TaxID=34632 RepID=UPI001895EFF6|nr:protein neuralized isoform X2 [Rhipicephalus sanguineus]
MGNTNATQLSQTPLGTAGATSFSSGQPMGFHEVHGENVRLEQGGKVARRAESFCKAIVFSSRPVQVNERVVLRITELSNGWSGALRLGFTSHDPVTLQGTLPKYACPDLTNRPGNWAKALGERYALENTLLHYYVNNAGEVFFGINGEEKGLFLNGVDVRGPLWALIDIYGNTTAIKMVEDEQLLNNRNEMIRNVTLNTGGVEDLIRQMEEFGAARETTGLAPVIAEASGSESLDGTPLQSPPHRRPTTMHAPIGTSWQRLMFHSVLGPNTRLDPMDKLVAERCDIGEQRAFVFASRTLCPNERLTVKVTGMDQLLSGSLAFGLTTCNPASLAHTAPELPADLDALLDRPEYWVFQKDIPCLLNDELTFVTGDDGRVQYSQNNGPFKTIMYVDGTQQFYPFFDIAGRVTRIRLVGSKRGSPVTEIEQSPEQPTIEKSTTKAPKKPVEESDDDCRICFEKSIDSVLVKCGHSLTCHDCGLKLLREAPQCPVCRQHIQEVIRIYKA